MARSICLFRRAFVLCWFSVLIGVLLSEFAHGAEPLLLRNPSLNKDRIAFLYANDIWTVSRDGGEARRLTSVNAVTGGPR
jgi:tricorn protease